LAGVAAALVGAWIVRQFFGEHQIYREQPASDDRLLDFSKPVTVERARSPSQFSERLWVALVSAADNPKFVQGHQELSLRPLVSGTQVQFRD
jgi:hypothetical protein